MLDFIMEAGETYAKKSLIFFAAFIAYLIIVLGFMHGNNVTRVYFTQQDAPLGIILILILLLAAYWQPKWHLPAYPPSFRFVLLVAIALTLLTWAGTFWVMWNYPLTRDEHMAVFDSQIYGTLKLSEPLALQWRAFSTALTPAFLLAVPDNLALVSNYMPGSAMMRAAFSKIELAELLNPLLVGVGMLALYRIALRLFSDSPAAIWLTLGAYVLSAQVLVNAMTTYAMTAHLVLNIIWLGLFLKDRPWSHLLAILVGLWSIGLHQIIFHPLFAGPFILTLLAQRRFTLFAVYAAVYAGALLLWISFQGLVLDLAGIQAGWGSAAQSNGFVENRIVPLLRIDRNALVYTMCNLLRLIMWAPAFAIVACLFAREPICRNQDIALPLFGGIALTSIAMIILLPHQGHGWGYRYLHPVMGNIALLAGLGFRHWLSQDSKADSIVILLAGVTTLLILPAQILMAHQFVKPHAMLTQLVSQQDSDFVLLDTMPPSDAIDEVRNRADLSNRPIVISSKNLQPGQLIELCERGTITPISRRSFHAVGLSEDVPVTSPYFEKQLLTIKGRPCLLPSPD
tara:strand:- start:26002 stop:27708 length:1707 start_codon:yes stop_codon:yes gene_type:complete